MSMDFRKHAFIVETVSALQRHGGRGKSHLQKSLFILKERLDVSVPFLYVFMHGPHSFEVEDELAEVNSYAAVGITLDGVEGGVTLIPSKNAEYVRKKAPLSPDELSAVGRACEFAASKNCADLETIATTVWVRRREGITDPNEVSRRVHELKPHVTLAEAVAADSEVRAALG